MNGARIAVFNLNETHRDPRVRRVSEALVNEGHSVKVFELRRSNQAIRECLDNFEIIRIEDQLSYTNEDMKAFGEISELVAELIHKCDPEVLHGPDDSQLRQSWRRIRRELRRMRRLPFLKRFATTPQKPFNPLGEILAIRSILLINLALYKAAADFEPEIIYCNDLDTLLTGVMLKITRGGILIFDAHEIYPEQLAEHMRSEIWYQFYSRLERYLIPYTDGRLTVCDSLGTYFQKTYKSAPFLTLRNTPSIKYLPDRSILYRRNQPVRLLYHGAYFPYRGLDELIAIADKIEKAVFIFRGIGGYETTLKTQVKANHLDHCVRFEPPVSIDELVSSASLCDIGLNPFISVCLNTEYALPNKYFEYMMAGLAVASSDLIEMRLLTKKLDNGILFDPTRQDQLIDCLNQLIQDQERLHAYRSHSYEAANKEFHWEHEEKKFRAYIRTLT